VARKKQQGNGSGTLYPRKNKDGKIVSYLGQYFGPDGKRRYVSAKHKGECREKLRAAMADADKGLVYNAGTITVSQYLDAWLKDSVKDTVRQRTYERYESIARVHIKPVLGRAKLKTLTPAHVRKLYREKLDAGLAPRTVNYIHTTLHKALKDAVADGLIPRNPSDAVKPPRPAKPEIRPLTQDQARALLAASKGDRFYALYVLALQCGLSSTLAIWCERGRVRSSSIRSMRSKRCAHPAPIFEGHSAPKWAPSTHLARVSTPDALLALPAPPCAREVVAG